jgi:glycine cleavage system H protein
MKNNGTTLRDLYRTGDHEWIHFQGSVAYIGICRFKLTGFRAIHQLDFKGASGFKKQGDIIAVVRYNDYCIECRMPVDGKILQINEEVMQENSNTLLQYPETKGWIALIAPSLPYERKNLQLQAQ